MLPQSISQTGVVVCVKVSAEHGSVERLAEQPGFQFLSAVCHLVGSWNLQRGVHDDKHVGVLLQHHAKELLQPFHLVTLSQRQSVAFVACVFDIVEHHITGVAEHESIIGRSEARLIGGSVACGVGRSGILVEVVVADDGIARHAHLLCKQLHVSVASIHIPCEVARHEHGLLSVARLVEQLLHVGHRLVKQSFAVVVGVELCVGSSND